MNSNEGNSPEQICSTVAVQPDAAKDITVSQPRRKGKRVTKSVAAGKKLADSAAKTPDLLAPELYLNRELTWLEFNRRVLHEAEDERTPLLERVKFAAIVSNNLDEFFMKRIGGLKQQAGAVDKNPYVDGRSRNNRSRNATFWCGSLRGQSSGLFRNCWSCCMGKESPFFPVPGYRPGRKSNCDSTTSGTYSR
jgi:hypothetical protein